MIETPELPSGTHLKARVVNGVLECWSLNVTSREWFYRFDAIVNGQRVTLQDRCPASTDIEALLERLRGVAREYFEKLDVEGK